MIQFFGDYFKAFEIISSESATAEEKKIAKISFASYFAIIPPIIFAIGYAITCIISKFNHTVSSHPSSDSAEKTDSLGTAILSPRENPGTKGPKVPDTFEPGFFVKAINAGEYVTKSGKSVTLKPVEHPEMFGRTADSVSEEITLLGKQQLSVNAVISFEDKTTEIAIKESTADRIIALNFANEFHAGGGPRVYQNEKGELVYEGPSARAQEESLCQRSTLLKSLLMIPHGIQRSGIKEYKNQYTENLDSRNRAVISHDTLFAVQEVDGKNWYFSEYLDEPKEVTFITSAAYNHHGKVDCTKGSDVYEDAKRRIETHLLAAAKESVECKRKNPAQSTEVILGAFGCGAFVPSNKREYREMIAGIYLDLLPQLKALFDKITFAVPTLSEEDKKDDSNVSIFSKMVYNSCNSQL